MLHTAARNGLICWAALVLVGCASKPEEVPVSVKGKVVDRTGKGIPNIVVTFHPQEEVNRNAGLPASKEPTQKDGSFSLQCLRGRYKITLAAVPTGPGHAPQGGGPGGAPPKDARSAVIPADYRAPERTHFDFRIPDTGQDDLVLKIQ